MIQPSIKTVNDLQGWFVQADKSSWLLFAGNRITQASTPLAVNYSVEDISGSWTELSLTLQRLGNVGTFTLLVKANKSDSKGALSTVIELNPNYQAPNQNQNQGIAGIAGTFGNGSIGMQGINEYSPQVKQHIDNQVAEKLSMERRLLQSEFDMKELKSQIGSSGSTTDKLIDAFVKNPEKIMIGIGSIFGKKTQTAALGVLSDDSKVPAQTEQVVEEQSTKPTQQNKQLDFNKVNQSAIVLFNNGVRDIDDIMLKMAVSIQNDKEAFFAKIEMLKGFM